MSGPFASCSLGAARLKLFTLFCSATDYRNTYIEFHLENLESRMEEGEYSVQIFVNGNPVESVDFTVE
jgi:hypothetical protein